MAQNHAGFSTTQFTDDDKVMFVIIEKQMSTSARLNKLKIWTHG